MGLSSWFRDLGVPWKITVGILGGVAAVTSAYGLYTFYIHQKDRKETSFNGETAGETSEKKVLVLGLDGAGKSTFLAALAQHDSPITSEREATKPTEGFHVVCVSTEGISLNIWESEYHSFIFNNHIFICSSRRRVMGKVGLKADFRTLACICLAEKGLGLAWITSSKL